MKKTLAIVLTVVMLFAVCVPAFAVPTEQVITTTPGSGDIIVKTLTTDENGKNAERFALTIPGDTDITWGVEGTDVSYSVESHLARNKAVKVTVSGSGDVDNYKMTTADGAYGIAYKLEGLGVDYTAVRPTVYPAEMQKVDVVVDADAWNKAVVESYSDILTYTAEVVTVTP